MRITANSNVEMQVPQNNPKSKSVESNQKINQSNEVNEEVSKVTSSSANTTISKTENSFDRKELEQAVDTMNELLDTTQKASKFVLHDGLNKYYVKLVDAKTEEVIKEIPPERLLDAFYEMQKLAGMIVDEKI